MARKLSEETKRKNAERIRNTYKTVSCCVPIELADEFREYCQSRGESVRENLKKYIERCLAENEN